MDSIPGDPLPLQFDTAVPRGTPAEGATAQEVTCAMCQRGISGEYFDVNGQSICDSCRTQLAEITTTPKSWGVFARAGVLGILAAIAGAILYYAVIAITNFEIGLVAIVIGYMVGWIVRKGAGGRGGRRFQVLALVLTYWSVGLAYTPLTLQQLAKDAKTEPAQTSTPDAAAANAPVGSPDEATPASIPLVLAILFGFSLALPVLAVISSLPGGLISAAIIVFGMRQAWRMTGTPKLQISGPYRIATATPASAV